MQRPVLHSFSGTAPSQLSLNRTAMKIINRYRARGVIISLIGNGKGGCGKSTVTMNTAIGYGWQTKRVLVIDADMEQLTTKKWPRPAHHTNPTVISCSSVEILAVLADEIADYDVVLIDLPGRDDRAIVAVMDIADLLISPTKACFLDMQELGRFIDIAQARGVPHLVVYNEATRQNTKELVQLRKQFSRFEPFLPVAIQHLSTYRRIYAQGHGVLDIRGSDPAKENFQRVFTAITKVVDEAHARRVSVLP